VLCVCVCACVCGGGHTCIRELAVGSCVDIATGRVCKGLDWSRVRFLSHLVSHIDCHAHCVCLPLGSVSRIDHRRHAVRVSHACSFLTARRRRESSSRSQCICATSCSRADGGASSRRRGLAHNVSCRVRRAPRGCGGGCGSGRGHEALQFDKMARVLFVVNLVGSE
jgi:hypothetical protein